MQANYIEFIRQIPLFAKLNQEELLLISQAAEVRSYRQNEVIFQQGQPVEGMLTMIAGQAVMLQTNTQGQQQPVATLITGQTINQEGLFQDAIQSTTLIASRPVQIVKLSRTKFMTLLAHHPELKVAFGMSTKETAHHAHDVHFAGQRENEETLLYLHRHWWAFIRLAWLPILIMVLMWFFGIIVGQAFLSGLLFFGSILLPGLTVLYLYVEWRNDLVIVTDQRVIRIRRTIITFSKKVSEVGIESVHEVNSEVPSNDPFARLFNYGTIEIKTAGNAGNLELDLIPNPDQFQQIIIEDRQRYEKRQAQQHHHSVRAELDSWLAGDTPDRIKQGQGAEASDDPSAPPRKKEGSRGYLSTRIEMTNGDVVYRKHLFVWLQQTIIPIILMVFSVGELFLSVFVGGGIGLIGLPLGILLFLIGASAYFWADWDWRNDYYVVSDSTITLIHQRPFFLQSLRDQILIERVDNVESESSGLFASIFKFGDVRVSLIGADEPKMFHTVPNPQEIQQDISRRLQRLKRAQSEAEARQQREVLAEYLNVYNQRLVDQGLVDDNPTIDTATQTPAYNYSSEGQFGNTPPGTIVNPEANSVLGRSSNPNVQIRAVNNRDRNRPPGIPRKQNSGTPPRPSMSPGVPYNPDNQARNRPTRFRPKPPEDL